MKAILFATRLGIVVLFASVGCAPSTEPTSRLEAATVGDEVANVDLPAEAQCPDLSVNWVPVGTALTLVPAAAIDESLTVPFLVATSCDTDQSSRQDITLSRPNVGGDPISMTFQKTLVTTGANSTLGWGALALRVDRGDLIGCTSNFDGHHDIYSIDIQTGAATFMFTTPETRGMEICDGLGWDVSTGRVYVAPDAGERVSVYSESGTFIQEFAVPDCLTSGIAVSGDSIYLTCQSQVTAYQLDKTTHAVITEFPSGTQRAADIECDPLTFASISKHVIWSKEAYNNEVFAFEIPFGTCVDHCAVSDLDSDSDGTADCLDACPSDPAKTNSGQCGCGVSDVDSDSDSFPDCSDGCPSDPAKVSSGKCGCGVSDADSDSDGRVDCHDGCPSDPAKTELGVCGCGVNDADSDSDGTADCHDECPSDPAKTEFGACGCGVSDADSDSDGTADCLDACPSDPNKTEIGICGCGEADTLPPVFTSVPADLTVTTCAAPPIGQAIAVDGCGVSVTNDAPAVFPLGETVVTWTAVDDSGNSTHATQIIRAVLGDDPSCCPADTNVILGTAGSDTLKDTRERDCILGLGGNDVILCSAGDDLVSGGQGDDSIVASKGDQVVLGGPGDDHIVAVLGNDHVDGGEGTDYCASASVRISCEKPTAR